VPTLGEKKATLYEARKAVHALVSVKLSRDRSTLDEARIRQTLADARCKELAAEKLEGSLVAVEEVLESQNAIFASIVAIVKKSLMSDNDKEDCLSEIAKAARMWESG